MGRVIVKNEDGKEVAYRRESFLGATYDVKIGDLHENFDGSKETRNSFDTNVRVERQRDFQFNERDGSVDGIEGKFSKDRVLGFEVDQHPGFKPSHSPGDDSDNSNDYAHGSTSSYIGGSGHIASPVKQNIESAFSSGDKYALIATVIGIFSKSFGAKIFMISSNMYELEKKYLNAALSAEKAHDVDRAISMHIKEGKTSGTFEFAEQYAKKQGLEKTLLQAYKENYLYLEAARVAAKLELADEAAEQYSVALWNSDTTDIAVSVSWEAVRAFQNMDNDAYLRKFCMDGMRFTRRRDCDSCLGAEMYYEHVIEELDKKGKKSRK